MQVPDQTTWRLIRHAPACGDWNMAVDEAILEHAASGLVPPTLRLYAWAPACLSLGQAQSTAEVDLDRLNERGWTLVRRQTGGRAILHADELTYAVAAPLKNPIVVGRVLDSYQRLAQALLRGLDCLALNARADATYPLGPGASRGDPICFEMPSQYEVTVGGKKLIGSAQARRPNGVLQHGSLPLGGNLTRITRVLAYPDEAARAEGAARLLNHATHAAAALSRAVSWAEAAAALEQGFREEFGLRFEPAELTSAEESRAEQLLREKYANPRWTLRR